MVQLLELKSFVKAALSIHWHMSQFAMGISQDASTPNVRSGRVSMQLRNTEAATELSKHQACNIPPFDGAVCGAEHLMLQAARMRSLTMRGGEKLPAICGQKPAGEAGVPSERRLRQRVLAPKFTHRLVCIAATKTLNSSQLAGQLHHLLANRHHVHLIWPISQPQCAHSAPVPRQLGVLAHARSTVQLNSSVNGMQHRLGHSDFGSCDAEARSLVASPVQLSGCM
jgi:hypothetical protein